MTYFGLDKEIYDIIKIMSDKTGLTQKYIFNIFEKYYKSYKIDNKISKKVFISSVVEETFKNSDYKEMLKKFVIADVYNKDPINIHLKKDLFNMYIRKMLTKKNN